MKVICNRGALLEALNVTGSVVAARTPKPALMCVRIAAADNEITVSATDLEVAVRYHDTQVEVSKDGELLIPADRLKDIVRESIDDTLSIETSGEMAVIKGQDSLFKIPTLTGDSFPPVGDFTGDADFEVQGGVLRQLIQQTAFAAAKASTRYAFNGVLFHVKGKVLTLVSTDGHRLAQAKTELAKAAKGDKDGMKAIVPIKAVTLIERLIGNAEESVGIQIRENQVIVHTSNATLTSILVEGQFPPFEDVIPKDTDRKMVASTADFLSAIRRTALVTTEESKGVRLRFNKTGLVLSSQSPIGGESTVNFPCKFEGADIDIGFNPAYLIDALKVVDTDDIDLELTAPNRPGLVTAGGNFLYVIMPVNIQG